MRAVGVLLFILFFGWAYGQSQGDILLLHGAWRFKADPTSIGIQEKWYTHLFDQTIRLPGSMAENGYGDRPSLTTPWMGSIWDSSWYFNPAMAKYRKAESVKFPFWLTPERYYVGAAWYQKEVTIPMSWKGKRVVLSLERPHWQTNVWIDSLEVGAQNSLSTPHRFEVVGAFSPGKHRITVRVDNQIHDVDPGNNSHSISDHTQGNWNGIVGSITLEALPTIYMEDAQVYPDIDKKSIVIKLGIKSDHSKWVGTLKATALSVGSSKNRKEILNQIATYSASYSALQDTLLEFTMQLGSVAKLWDEFSPNTYTLKLEFSPKTGGRQVLETDFGLRQFNVVGNHFEINGRPVFLRGTVECCVFPQTGYPPTDEASWIRVFTICKSYGMNHMRFHSYCPSKAAFKAADKVGIYLQVEGPSWANYSTALGKGLPIDTYIYEECNRIVKEYGNHPSFCMMAYGNEPNKAADYVTFLNNFVDYWKLKDARRVYTGASIGGSWEMIPRSQFHVRAKPRGLAWKGLPETMFDYGDKLENQTIPYITHEMGQWCVFPNFNEMQKYTGVYSAGNFEIFQDILQERHLGDMAHHFLLASGKLQALCYKMEVEAALRTAGLSGFQLLGLNDFPGQGTALTGVLDVFWDNKGYITPQEFRQFCNVTVPLARIPKFVFSNNESFKASVEIAHFGAKSYNKTPTYWSVTDMNRSVIDSGRFVSTTVAIGSGNILGSVTVPLDKIKIAKQLRFNVSIDTFVNHWDFWVYPSQLPWIDTFAIYTCNVLDSKAESVLKAGGNVLVLAAGKVENGKEVSQYFTPVFWNTSWFKMRPPHTTGIFIDVENELFTYFPTSYYSTQQWYELLQKQQVMIIDSFPADFKPIVSAIDTWFLNRRLAILFEAKVFNGKLVVCSADVFSAPDRRIVAKQLLWGIRNYMNSQAFAPKQELSWSCLTELFEKKNRKTWDSFTKEVPDELKKTH